LAIVVFTCDTSSQRSGIALRAGRALPRVAAGLRKTSWRLKVCILAPCLENGRLLYHCEQLYARARSHIHTMLLVVPVPIPEMDWFVTSSVYFHLLTPLLRVITYTTVCLMHTVCLPALEHYQHSLCVGSVFVRVSCVRGHHFVPPLCATCEDAESACYHNSLHSS
jgi:hypothetical protein